MEYEPTCGQTIEHAAGAAIRMAQSAGGSARMKFNDVDLLVVPTDTAAAVCARYQAESERKAKEWRESPEGIACARRAALRKENLQRIADRLMEELPGLDFQDLRVVLSWMRLMQEPSDYIGVWIPKQDVVSIFVDQGYAVGANCGPDFRLGDPDNEARWIIGQCLSCLRSMGAIHGVTHKFVDEWMQKFSTWSKP